MHKEKLVFVSNPFKTISEHESNMEILNGRARDIVIMKGCSFPYSTSVMDAAFKKSAIRHEMEKRGELKHKQSMDLFWENYFLEKQQAQGGKNA